MFCDITVLAPLSRRGQPRGGTNNRGGRLLEDANNSNATTYHEVPDTGLGVLYCLGCEVYGRWGQPCIELVPALAREHARGMHPRIRRGAALGFQTRWWSLLSVALQKAVANAVLRPEGADLPTTSLALVPPLGDLPVV